MCNLLRLYPSFIYFVSLLKREANYTKKILKWCFDSFWWKYRSILVLEIQLLLLWTSYFIYRFPTRNWGWLDHFLKKVASTDSMTSKASKPSWTWATSCNTKVTKGWQFVCSIMLLTSIEFSRNQKWRSSFSVSNEENCVQLT